MNNLALKGLKIDNSESKQNNYNNKDMNIENRNKG